MCRLSRNPGRPRLIYPQVLVQVCTGIALPDFRIEDVIDLIYIYMGVVKKIGHMKIIELVSSIKRFSISTNYVNVKVEFNSSS
jgi:hypothetical protein